MVLVILELKVEADVFGRLVQVLRKLLRVSYAALMYFVAVL